MHVQTSAIGKKSSLKEKDKSNKHWRKNFKRVKSYWEWVVTSNTNCCPQKIWGLFIFSTLNLWGLPYSKLYSRPSAPFPSLFVIQPLRIPLKATKERPGLLSTSKTRKANQLWNVSFENKQDKTKLIFVTPSQTQTVFHSHSLMECILKFILL